MISVRTATGDDREFIAGLVDSLLEFGSLLWRDPRARADGYRQVLIGHLDHPGPDAETLIAVDDAGGRPLGFISLRVVAAAGSGRRARVADLAVSPAARRAGVGTALMRAAEGWCAQRGLDAVDLDVWASNERALAFYGSLGYLPDSHHLAKPLRSEDAHGLRTQRGSPPPRRP